MAPDNSPLPYPPDPTTESPSPLARRTRLGWPLWSVIGVAIAVVALIALRLALPSILHWYVSKTIDKVPPYHGVVGDIDVSLWRGAYQIHDLKLVKVDGDKPPVPFFAADVIDLSVEWGALLHGSVVGKVILKSPKINFVANSDGGAKQTGISPSWSDQFAKLFPLKIDKATMHDGEIWFHNYTSHPPVNLKLDHLEGTAENLCNSRHLSQSLVTQIDVHGRAMESGKFRAHVSSDVFIKPPSFELTMAVDDLDLTRLNDFFKAYVNAKAASGTFSLYAEIKSNHGNFTGYLKPLIDHLAIEIGKDPNPLQVVWDSVVAMFTEILRNQPKDRIATVIPLHGSVQDPHFGVLDSVFNVLRNAFIRSFVPGFENQLPGDVQKQLKTPPPQPTETSPDQKK